MLSEFNNSILFVQKHSKTTKYVKGKGWLNWNGKYWDFGSGEELEKALLLQEHFQKQAELCNDEDEAKKITSWAKACGSLRVAKSTLEIASNKSEIALSVEDLDVFNDYTTLNNCAYDIKNKKQLSFNPNHFSTKIIKIDYNLQAVCPTWDKYLADVCCDDPELIEYMYRCIGYSLTGSCKEQKMFLIVGNGANGKSVFLETLYALFGTYAERTDTDLITASQTGNGSNSSMLLAKLASARLALLSEIDLNAKIDEKRVKIITGRERAQARELYQPYFDFLPKFKLWITTNNKPNVRAMDHGMWRKFAIVPFLATFSEEKMDKDLLSKLLLELEGILIKCLEGAKRWYEGGIPDCPKVKAALLEYREEQDTIARFISDTCEVDEFQCVGSKALHNAYKKWCDEEGEYCLSNIKFSREVAKRYKKEVDMYGAKFLGIALKLEGGF